MMTETYHGKEQRLRREIKEYQELYWEHEVLMDESETHAEARHHRKQMRAAKKMMEDKKEELYAHTSRPNREKWFEGGKRVESMGDHEVVTHKITRREVFFDGVGLPYYMKGDKRVYLYSEDKSFASFTDTPRDRLKRPSKKRRPKRKKERKGKVV
jgi:hypothetical protein